MDSGKARELEDRLVGTTIGGWSVIGLIDSGKSAAVFKASRGDELAALKIFDDELIERYGDKTQLARIDRELGLIGQHHPNLVRIVDGGVDTNSGNHFIVMQLLSGPNLAKCLADVPSEYVPGLVEQLAAAAKFLDERGYVHRDIKPENIILVDDFRTLVLLDFGVLRPLKGSTLTDVDGVQPFVGTLQYSSPEFLLREEEDSPDGWRALSFYQIGGVIHDLIMRRPLFQEYATPYARLVNAVQQVTPEIQDSAAPRYLTEVARCCLLKDWKKRLELVDWSSFAPPNPRSDSAGSARQRFTNRALVAAAARGQRSKVDTDSTAAERLLISRTRDNVSFAVRSMSSDNPHLPVLKVILPREREDSVYVEFSPSEDVGMEYALGILLLIECIDVPSRIVKILSAAVMGRATMEQCLSSGQRQMFQGTNEPGAIFEAVEYTVYNYLEMAQNAILEGDTKFL